MGPKLFGNIVLMIVLVLAQVLVCNRIMLFGVAVAFVFIYVVVSLPMKLKTDWLLTWAFVSGLLVDVFVDTPGVNALSCTLLAMMKKPVLYAYIPRDDHTKTLYRRSLLSDSLYMQNICLPCRPYTASWYSQ